MNNVAMNPTAAGGPVGGGMMMMNNGNSPAMTSGSTAPENIKIQLNTYIYEYILRCGLHDIARNLVRDEKFDIRTSPKSPNQRKNGEMNGDNGDGMDMDKEDIPDDLPKPAVWETGSGTQGHGFLLEWFSVFSDIFSAHRTIKTNTNGHNMTPASQYLTQHQQMQRMRETQGRNMPAAMMNNVMLRNMQNGMMNGTDAQRMNKNMTPQQMTAMQNNRNKQMQMQQQMQRADQPEGEINGRPDTPADGDSAGSPSKRPRLDGQQQFNGAMMANNRPAGAPAAGQNMMIQSGFNPNMNPAANFRQNGAMPQKAMQANMANGMMNMGNAGSPMMQGMNSFPEGLQMDLYNRNNMAAGQNMQAGAAAASSGNHALQDYQMQLMLLEQQNKKRLMMARQEQHDQGPREGGMPGMPGGMSPSGSRTGTSPNPEAQMKRTPQLGGPGSPSAGDLMQGRSPAGMNFMNGMQPPDFNGGMMMGGAAPGMRPPTSNDMNAMRQQGARANGQFQGGQPMAQQPSQGQQQMGTPGQRNEMPPPSAPAGANNGQRQTGSPSGQAPPTPSQTNKPNPKNKKNAKEDGKRNRPGKKGGNANANNNDENPPATPTPSTPITPNNPGLMNANKGQAGMQQGQGPNAGMQQVQQQMPQQEMQPGFTDFTAPDPAFNLDFSTLENADVLENFDFDSFLNTSADDGFNFDASIGVDTNFMDHPE